MARVKITVKEKRSMAAAKARQQQLKNGTINMALKTSILRHLELSFTRPPSLGSLPPPSSNRFEDISIHYVGPDSESRRVSDSNGEEEVTNRLLKIYICREIAFILDWMEVIRDVYEEFQSDLDEMRRDLHVLQGELGMKPSAGA